MPLHPVLFVSHGAPSLPLEPGATGALWAELGATLPRPRAILVISAHWPAAVPTISMASAPETIHDFNGFPEPLYGLRYPASGAPGLAPRVSTLLAEHGIPFNIAERGLDHGAWVPLSLMYPAADIPVAQLALQPHRDPSWHYRLGQALAALRAEGVLILASGSLSHNLRELSRSLPTPPAWMTEFQDWMAVRVAEHDLAGLFDYRNQAPHAARNHPTDEHLLPLYVALGAAGPRAAVIRHDPGTTFGALAMDAWVWN